MKMSYQDAITKYNALAEIEKGKNPETPYDLPPEAYVLITMMMNALKPYAEGYQKGRTARFKKAAGSNVKRDQFEQITFVDPNAELKFRAKEERILGSIVNIQMPTTKLVLNIKENKIPATLLLRIDGLWEVPKEKEFQFHLEEGQFDAPPVEEDEEEDGSSVIQLRKPLGGGE